jgi:hypothetical protein
VARTAARAGRVVAEYEEMREADRRHLSLAARMRDWMVSFLQRYGFWGVVAMRSVHSSVCFVVFFCCSCCSSFRL